MLSQILKRIVLLYSLTLFLNCNITSAVTPEEQEIQEKLAIATKGFAPNGLPIELSKISDKDKLIRPEPRKKKRARAAYNSIHPQKVSLVYVTDENGDVVRFQIIETTSTMFAENLQKFIQRTKYKPAKLNGKPVKFLQYVTYDYTPK